MTPSGWLLLVTNLPGRKQALRMRVWRALKAAGAGNAAGRRLPSPDFGAGAAATR
jgi:hypothetical protein